MNPIAITSDGARILASQRGEVCVFEHGRRRWSAPVHPTSRIALVGDQVWIGTPEHTELQRFDLAGGVIDPLPLGRALAPGVWAISPLAASAVWNDGAPLAIRGDSVTPLTGADAAAPIVDGRWLLWRAGHAALRRPSGEVWKVHVDDLAATLLDAMALLDGRMIALWTAGRTGEEQRVIVVGARDGGTLTSMRVTGARNLRFAGRRGVALLDLGGRVTVVDLRFGRVLRECVVPAGLDELVVDDALQYAVVRDGDRLLGVRFEDAMRGTAEVRTEAPPAEDTADGGEPVEPVDELHDRTLDGHGPSPTDEPVADTTPRRRPRATPPGWQAQDPDQPVSPAIPPVEPASIHHAPPHDPPPPAEPAPPPAPLPDTPLLALDPLPDWPRAGALEARRALDARLDLLGARVWLNIAEAWNSGRIVQPDPAEPPFAAEVVGLLGVTRGRAESYITAARNRGAACEQAVIAADRGRAGRLLPIDVLARQFGLSPLAATILMIVAAPSLRGDYARLYGILGNDPSRPLCDEQLVIQMMGASQAAAVARELDSDRPLRKYSLITMGDTAMPRPFASLTIEPLVVRMIGGQPLDADPEPFLTARPAGVPLDEVRVPRATLRNLLDTLAPARPKPLRLVARGRLGSGRHTVLAAVAARANRVLGVIDLSAAPREPGKLLATLRGALRRAVVRGWVPCVDGLEHLLGDDVDLRGQVSAIFREHPGPLALRLGPDASPPFEAGYVVLDLPPLDEAARAESWQAAITRHALAAADTTELAARYRVGPGVAERVCAEIARGPRLTEPAAVTRAIDTGVRQHLEHRIGSIATRVSRSATWSDVVLPEDVLDSLVAFTGRVRHRRTVFERWGYGRTMTTSRGITALFTGGPGTGKTMVAGVLARDLGVELYQVDVSRITSKWIGETEKNLANLFDAAEDGQVMLLFDEADSLFAKRTEVRTSVDRYANMEVNYLLQRLDSFEGIAILTSNFGTAIDPAFKRRLSFRVTFPFPDEEMRERLWRTLIPPEAPLAAPLEFTELAQRFRMSGGYIRNASLRAAFLAAEEGVALSQDHLERAVRAEFREIGKLADTGTLE